MLLGPNLALMDTSCRQFHHEERHCAQKHLFFSCTLTILLGALYLWHFVHEWMTSWCCRPLLCSLLTSVLAVVWPMVHLSVLAIAPTRSNRLWPHCRRAGAHTAAKGRPMHSEEAPVPWLSSHLWVWKHVRAVGILQRAMPDQGSPLWCSSQQRMCRICVLMLPVLFCALIFLQGNALVYAVHSLDDSYHVFLWISGEPGPCYKRWDDQKKWGSAVILYFSASL